MKNLSLFLVMTLLSLSAFGARVYYEDGNFYKAERLEGSYAKKIDRFRTAKIGKVLFNWKIGADNLVLTEDMRGNMPIYFLGEMPVVSDNYLFYEGNVDPGLLERRYGMKLVEILPSYNLRKFLATEMNAVEIAQKIFESGDGYAFPNFYRQVEPKGTLNYPIEDPYYETYQWFLKNRGTHRDVNDKSIETLENADIRFDDAMAFINSLVNEEKLSLEQMGAFKVAVLDSGVVPDHEDLTKIEAGYDAYEVLDTGRPDIPDDFDPAGNQQHMMLLGQLAHGTSCAGVSAAEGNGIGVSGVCPWCGVYPVRFLGGPGNGAAQNDEMYLKTYEKIIADDKIVAINCSFGPMAMPYAPMSSGEKKALQTYLEKGRGGKGGAILYASGNDNIDAGYQQLLSYKFKVKRGENEIESSVITVGASSAWDTRVIYSNHGEVMDVITPSLSSKPLVGMTTTAIPGFGDYNDDYTLRFSGTSSAAPVATGAFGVIFSVNPDLTLEEAMEILKESSDKINPETGFYDEEGHSTKFGYGRLNLLKAVRLARKYAGDDIEMCETVTNEIPGNNIDDDCDGLVDENEDFNLEKKIGKTGSACESDADCVTGEFKEGMVKCLRENGFYKFKDGYCVLKLQDSPCPDGTVAFSDSDLNYCFKDCNENNICDREGFFCDDKSVGKCLPKCESDDDCAGDSSCSDDGTCKRNPSEIFGPCASNEECKYDAFCITQIPEGLCMKMCSMDNDEMCGGDAKCTMADGKMMGQGDMEICLPSCEKNSDCRDLYGMLVCHEYRGGKEGMCFVKCKSDAECYDENAMCNSQGVCVKKESDEKETPDEDNVADQENVEMDKEPISEANDEDEAAIPPKEKKSSDGGCSLLLI